MALLLTVVCISGREASRESIQSSLYNETAEETVWRVMAGAPPSPPGADIPILHHTQPRKETQEPEFLIIVAVFFNAATCTVLEIHKPFTTCGYGWCKTQFRGRSFLLL